MQNEISPAASDGWLITQFHHAAVLLIKFLECFQQTQIWRKSWLALKLFTKLGDSLLNIVFNNLSFLDKVFKFKLQPWIPACAVTCGSQRGAPSISCCSALFLRNWIFSPSLGLFRLAWPASRLLELTFLHPTMLGLQERTALPAFRRVMSLLHTEQDIFFLNLIPQQSRLWLVHTIWQWWQEAGRGDEFNVTPPRRGKWGAPPC